VKEDDSLSRLDLLHHPLSRLDHLLHHPLSRLDHLLQDLQAWSQSPIGGMIEPRLGTLMMLFFRSCCASGWCCGKYALLVQRVLPMLGLE